MFPAAEAVTVEEEEGEEEEAGLPEGPSDAASAEAARPDPESGEVPPTPSPELPAEVSISSTAELTVSPLTAQGDRESRYFSRDWFRASAVHHGNTDSGMPIQLVNW